MDNSIKNGYSSISKVLTSKPKSSDTNFNATIEMSKIASAETKAQLKAILSNLKGRAARLKKFENQEALIKKINKLIEKGEDKVKKLDIELRLEKKRKEAEKNQELKQAKKIREDILNKKRNRKFKELDDVKNADKIVSDYSTDITSHSNLNISTPIVSDNSDLSIETIDSVDVSSIDLTL